MPTRLIAGIFLPPLASGILLYLSFFPVNWGWLGWVALVPFLTLVRSSGRTIAVYLAAWVGGLVFFWPALQWLPVADDRMYFTWAFLATYCSLYFPLALYLIRWLDQRTRLPLIVSVPVVWTALEFLRSFFATGFGWYLIGHSQHDFLPIIQFADLTGAWGVTFLVAAVNGFATELFFAARGRGLVTRFSLLVQGSTLAAVIVCLLGYGFWRVSQTDFSAGPRVALIQGNLPQSIRNNPTTIVSIFNHYAGLTDVAVAGRPDLVVWPETSMPEDWSEVWPDGPPAETRDFFVKMAQRFKTPTLYGLNSSVIGPDRKARRYNSGLLIDANGVAVARYDKIHRVPFGEYVPLRDWFPFLNYFAPYDFDYSVSPGSGPTRFPLQFGGQESTFGVVICYEDTDPDITRLYGGEEHGVATQFLLNISNDGWFNGTSEHEEHLAICRFRAIECRRAIGRAVNIGISAMIDGNGGVLSPKQMGKVEVPSGVDSSSAPAALWRADASSPKLPTSQWSEFKKRSGVLIATVPVDSRWSFYVFAGDWLPWLCWFVLVVMAGRIARSSRKQNTPIAPKLSRTAG